MIQQSTNKVDFYGTVIYHKYLKFSIHLICNIISENEKLVIMHEDSILIILENLISNAPNIINQIDDSLIKTIDNDIFCSVMIIKHQSIYCIQSCRNLF
jgi:hypothetical protein